MQASNLRKWADPMHVALRKCTSAVPAAPELHHIWLCSLTVCTSAPRNKCTRVVVTIGAGSQAELSDRKTDYAVVSGLESAPLNQ